MIGTPLQKIQNEAAMLPLSQGETAFLGGLLVKAFDAGLAAAKEVAAETATYTVSLSPDGIEPFDDDGDLVYYETPEDAGQAILKGFHGETGTRYVLRVTTAVEVVYDRAWTLVRKDA